MVKDRSYIPVIYTKSQLLNSDLKLEINGLLNRSGEIQIQFFNPPRFWSLLIFVDLSLWGLCEDKMKRKGSKCQQTRKRSKKCKKRKKRKKKQDSWDIMTSDLLFNRYQQIHHFPSLLSLPDFPSTPYYLIFFSH